MREVAKVVKIDREIVEVQTFSDDPGACKSCPLKGLCAAKKNIHAVNPQRYELNLGDMVEINVPTRVSISGLSALLYGIPVVMLIVVMMVLQEIFALDVYVSLAVAAICVGVYYWLLNFITKRKVEKISPTIVKKITNTVDNS